MKRIFVAIFCGTLLLGASGVAFAELEFKKTEYQVTSGINDMKMSFEFPFVNKSSETVKIKEVKTSCSCLTAWLADEVDSFAAGASGVVHLDIDLGAFGGKVEKEATVVTSEGQKILIKLVVEVPQFVKIEPQTLKWTVGEERTAKKMKLIIHKDLNLKLEEVGISKEGFDYEPKTIKAGKEYEIIVTPKSTDSPEFALLTVVTNSTQPRYKKIMGYLSINQPSGKK